MDGGQSECGVDVTIDTIGADGDGISCVEGRPVYFPYTLPGERVVDGVVVIPSPDRQPAPCGHLGSCGGCTLQHWRDPPYAAWKSQQVESALTRAGFESIPMEPLARTPEADRRRVDLALAREAGAVRVGLHRRRSHEVIDLQICLVLEPRLVALIAALRRVLRTVSALRRTGSAVANVLDTGIDLLLRTDGPLSPADRAALAVFAREAGLCRVAWAQHAIAEVAVQLEPAVVTLSGVPVTPPPGAFLQASHAGSAAISAAVIAGLPERLPPRAKVVELFAGVGTLSFALAAHVRVIAYEGDAGAHAGLRRAIAGRPIEALHRDLARQPLTAKEMAGAAAVVLDPPFAGAAAQMAGIAASGVPRVIYVSCNPAALLRDSRALQNAGYRVRSATPVDQFLWSAAVESVTVFEQAPYQAKPSKRINA